MSEQMDMFGPSQSTPEDPRVEQFIRFLDARTYWFTAAQIQLVHPEWSDREIRKFAELADPQIISGQRGYKHTRHATPEEVHHFVHWMESQGKKMIARAESIRRYTHALLG